VLRLHVVREGGEAAVVRGAELVLRDVVRREQELVPDLLRGFHPRILRVRDPDEADLVLLDVLPNDLVDPVPVLLGGEPPAWMLNMDGRRSL
jgi:hypothetical protein